MSQGFDLRILILYKTGAPLSQSIMVSTVYFSSKIRRVLPNFMHFTVFNNAGKEKPGYFVLKGYHFAVYIYEFLVFVSFYFYMRWQAVE
jgi:hypothetical protein